MFINQILDDLGRDALVELFGLAVVGAVEANLIEKNSKPYVRCLVRKKEVQAKREELVRQLWLYRLMFHYKYPVTRLAVEYPITFGRDSDNAAKTTWRIRFSPSILTKRMCAWPAA